MSPVERNKIQAQSAEDEFLTDRNKSRDELGEYYNINNNMYHPPHEVSSQLERRVTVKVIKLEKQRGILNPVLISLVIILYLLPNPTFLLFSKNELPTSTGLWKGNASLEQLKGRSLVGLAEASPAPEPSAAARAKTSGSGSPRVPPMNGSIFGKRSLSESNEQIKDKRYDYDQTVQETTTNSQEKINQVKSNQRDVITSKGYIINKPSKQVQKSQANNEITNYKDLITDIIEDFLRSNNENDPEETSVAFCRMIVYECTQMLSERRKLTRRSRRG